MPDWLDWLRPELRQQPSGNALSELVASPASARLRPWVLFVGEDETSLENAASRWIEASARDLPRLSPPDAVSLPLAAHRLSPPLLTGERLLYLPRLDRAFFPPLPGTGAFSATSPAYLLPCLTHLAADGEPLTVVATAVASELARRGKDVLAQRGLANRFEIRSVAGKRTEPREERRPSEGLDKETRRIEAGLRSGDASERASLFESAVRSSPESGLARLFLASSFLERRMLPDALETLRRTITLDPELAAAHYELGKLLIQTDDVEGALASFRRTVELVPEYASAWGNLGAALGESQDLAGASTALERAVGLDPRSHALHSNLGVAYRDLGRLSEAEGELRTAVELDSDFVFGHYNLANVLYLDGRFEEAIASFEQARSMDPSGSPRQTLLLAATRLASGDVDGAHRDYRSVLERLTEPMRSDMRTVAEWDLNELARRRGLHEMSPELQQTVDFLRSLA